MKLNALRDRDGSTQSRKRVGRGIGSGRGKTCGSGHKGQKARSGVSIKGFEGGQMPIHRRLPKRGFTNIFRKKYVEVNLSRIQSALDAGVLDKSKPITAQVLVSSGVISKPKDGVRILGMGMLKDKLEIHAVGASKSAQTAIEKAGGTLILPPASPPAKADPAKADPDKTETAKAKKGEAKKVEAKKVEAKKVKGSK